jgi:putative nucleotidyltransferase with HDIG domain
MALPMLFVLDLDQCTEPDVGDPTPSYTGTRFGGKGIPMVPPVETCLSLMSEAGMPEHIRRHSIMVEQAAAVIARGHIGRDILLSLERVRAGALLHDIAKAECLASGGDHASRGREICVAWGFVEIAEIVGEHVRLRGFQADGEILEKEIVYYADKRVNHDRIVSLEERLEKLIDRYGKGEKELERRMEQNFELCRRVERKLFQRLEFTPDSLPRLVSGPPPGYPEESAT